MSSGPSWSAEEPDVPQLGCAAPFSVGSRGQGAPRAIALVTPRFLEGLAHLLPVNPFQFKVACELRTDQEACAPAIAVSSRSILSSTADFEGVNDFDVLSSQDELPTRVISTTGLIVTSSLHFAGLPGERARMCLTVRSDQVQDHGAINERQLLMVGKIEPFQVSCVQPAAGANKDVEAQPELAPRSPNPQPLRSSALSSRTSSHSRSAPWPLSACGLPTSEPRSCSGAEELKTQEMFG
eukprot:CAMPEP_0184288920 /NCGR_PEP_ID=MMETSP1049-20130417/1423_1 /TAXON_ID=77928 /ORGANISM="Proteomonas sulcata, Strain CCMP704" /LENGTH=238 /DNA_ID=CAMNT_0026595529 /DNA_START=378 /DNA_END=1097 /DNA_ORIENTATION=-